MCSGIQQRPSSDASPIVLYDGVCGLCNRLNQFLLKRDRNDRFRFASLQSDFARLLLARHDADSRDLDTVYVVLNHGLPNERLLARSDAILYMLAQLPGIWKLASLARWIPCFLRDAVYWLIAQNRYRVFGKYETCMLPEPRHRAKFLEV